MKKPLAIAVALLLAGCGTIAKNHPRAAIGKAVFQECLAASDIASMRSSCFLDDIDHAGPDAPSLAKRHWDESVAKMTPNERLLAAVLRPNLAAAKAALASGANLNHEFTNRVVHGPRAFDPQQKTTALQIAVKDLEPKLAEFLLLEGANPNWRESEADVDIFTLHIGMKAKYTDKMEVSATGLDMAELGLKYGLVPTAPSLIRLEALMQGYKPGSTTATNVKPFYDALIQRMTPNIERQLADLKEELRLAAKQRAIKEQKQQEARMEAEKRMRLASEQLNARKRVVGTRICKEQPSQFGPLIYVGYVEGLGPEKVQIRVSNAVYKGAPSLSPGGFRETILWDYPNSWNICE